MLNFAIIGRAHFVILSTNVIWCELVRTYAGGIQITDEPTTTVARVPKTHNIYTN